MLKAVIFDMDGVIIDSERHWPELEIDYLRQHIPGWDCEKQAQLLGISMEDSHRMLCVNYGMTVSLEEYVRGHEPLAVEIYGKMAALMPGAARLVKQLADAGLMLAIATSSPRRWMDMILERFSLGSYFAAWASGEELPGRGKPHPDVYLLAAERLGVPAACCCAVEDSDKGVAAARAAGMKCVALCSAHVPKERLSQAHLAVSNLSELTVESLRGLYKV